MPNTPLLRRELGASGTLINNGIITAEEYNRKLSGRQALQIYDVMSRSDADIHGILEVCKLPVVSATFSIIPAKDKNGEVTDADQQIADHVEHELFHVINWDDFLYQALDILDFGHSVFEKVYELHDYHGQKRWGFSKIAFRKQTTIYAWETRDHKPGITQQTATDTYDIPMEKLVVFTNKKRGDNYEGISLLRYVYKDWTMKDKLTLVNALALEKLGVGVPVIRESQDGQAANPNDINAAEAAMAEFRANEAGYIKEPKGLTIEMLDMKGNTTRDILPTLNYHKRAIFTSVLATFLDLGGSSGSGSQSLSKDLTALFNKSEEYIAKTICAVINEQVIKQLCDPNYSSLPNGYPTISYGTIADDDITALADAMSKFMTAGALTPDAEMEDIIRGKVGMPQMSKEAKDNYEANRQQQQELAAKAAEAKAQPKADQPEKKPATKKEAAIQASRDAQRRIIEVIYADEG